MTEKILIEKKIFIGSPSDVTDERRLFVDIIDEVNQTTANPKGIQLKSIRWEDVAPGAGRPQGLINELLKDCHLIVLILWRKWGSPTGEYSSGFEEEYEISKWLHENKKEPPEIFIYFRDMRGKRVLAKDKEKIVAFKQKIKDERNFFYKSYQNDKEWERLFRINLCNWLNKLQIIDLKHYLNISKPVSTGSLDHEPEFTIVDAQEAVIKYNQAKVMEREGKTEKAYELYREVIELLPLPSIINEFGVFLLSIGRYDEAQTMFMRIL